MRLPRITALGFLALFATPIAASTATDRSEDLVRLLGRICSTGGEDSNQLIDPTTLAQIPTAKCGAQPTSFASLPSLGDGGDLSVDFRIGYDHDTKRLCFNTLHLPQAPVLRVGVGHTLTVKINNTLHDTGIKNCPIDTFGSEGYCLPKPVFAESPGPDGDFYPIMAQEAHIADGITNLHVHGLFVPPLPCSDDVITSAIYPANWPLKTELTPSCQSQANSLTYTYQLPPDHPAGAYWYHTHRHGEAEHQTQMGLVGAIVVEDKGDRYRKSIGVTDEVLLVTDIPNVACLIGVNCDAKIPPRRQPHGELAREAARASGTQTPISQNTAPSSNPNVLDPRIDQLNQAGECAQGASDNTGGTELWTLLLNGAPVPEELNGFPPDNELLTKTMQPGQRQIFRLVNASANSFVAPQLVLSQNGSQTTLPLTVFARDGVGMANKEGHRHFANLDVSTGQFIVPPSGRVEFVVHAPPSGATLYLQSAQVAPGCGGNAYPARRLLLITSGGTPVDPGSPSDDDLLRDTPSLHPYLKTLSENATIHRTFVLAEYGRGFTYPLTKWRSGPPSIADYDPSQTDFYLTEIAASDGSVNPSLTALKPFGHHQGPQVVVHLHGKESVTEEWLVQNSTLEIHAFHMHQIHFRDISTPGSDPDQHPLLDVITVPAAPLVGDIATGYPGAPGWVKLRMTFTKADIGAFVYHCHILEHEDNGMMGKIEVEAD